MADCVDIQKKAADAMIAQKVATFITKGEGGVGRSEWKSIAEICFEYIEGKQWTAEELDELEKRHQPPTVNNQMKLFVDHVMGQYLVQDMRVVFRGRNTPADDQSERALTALKLFVEQNTGMRAHKNEVVKDAVTSGIGVLRVTPKVNPDAGTVEIVAEHIDCLEVFYDPASRKMDWNKDTEFVGFKRRVMRKRLQVQYPGLQLYDECVAADYNDTLEVVECWWKEYRRVSYLRLPNGKVVKLENKLVDNLRIKFPQLQLFDEIDETLHMAVTVGGQLAEYVKDPFQGISLFPLIPLFIERKKKTGAPYSLVEIGKPMQDAINKREAKALHLLNTNQLLVGQNGIRDKAEVAAEMARPDGIVEVKDITQIQILRNTDLAVSQMNFHQAAVMAIRLMLGINPDALGERSEVRSGIGIQRKQAATALTLQPINARIDDFELRLSQLEMAYIIKYFNKEMTFKITDDPAMGDFMGQVFTINQRQDDGNVVNDITAWMYDIVIDRTPDTATLEQEEFLALSQALPQLSQMNPAWAILLVQVSHFKRKDQIIQMLQQAMSQQTPERPKISLNMNWDNMSSRDKDNARQMMGQEAQGEQQDGEQQTAIPEELRSLLN